MFFHCVPTCRTICPHWSGVRVQVERFRIKVLSNFIFLFRESIISLLFQFNCFLLIFNNIRCLLWVLVYLNRRIQRSVDTETNFGRGQDAELERTWRINLEPNLSNHWTHNRSMLILIDRFLALFEFNDRKKLHWSNDDDIISTIYSNRMAFTGLK